MSWQDQNFQKFTFILEMHCFFYELCVDRSPLSLLLLSRRTVTIPFQATSICSLNVCVEIGSHHLLSPLCRRLGLNKSYSPISVCACWLCQKCDPVFYGIPNPSHTENVVDTSTACTYVGGFLLFRGTPEGEVHDQQASSQPCTSVYSSEMNPQGYHHFKNCFY